MLVALVSAWRSSALALALLTGVPDAAALAVQADSLGVPLLVALAVPTVESGVNLNPLLRGKNGDLGRFQVRGTVWRHAFNGECKVLSVYRSNVRCGLHILRWCYEREGNWSRAVTCYNGRGPQARLYASRVERVAGRLSFRLASIPGVFTWPPLPPPSSDSLVPSSSSPKHSQRAHGAKLPPTHSHGTLWGTASQRLGAASHSLLAWSRNSQRYLARSVLLPSSFVSTATQTL